MLFKCAHFRPHCVHAGLTSNMFVARLRHACGHGDCCVCAMKCSCGHTLGSLFAPHALHRVAVSNRKGLPSALSPYHALTLPLPASLHRGLSTTWAKGLTAKVERATGGPLASRSASATPKATQVSHHGSRDDGTGDAAHDADGGGSVEDDDSLQTHSPPSESGMLTLG